MAKNVKMTSYKPIHGMDITLTNQKDRNMCAITGSKLTRDEM